MAVKLTEGAISVICNGNWQPTNEKPVIQLLKIGSVPPGNASEENKKRHQVLLSDGSFFQRGLLAIQLNDLVRSHQLQRGSIVQLTDFVFSTINGNMIIIVTGLHVILSNYDIIGNAQQFRCTPGNEPSTLRSQSPMQYINQPTRTTDVPRPNFGANSPNYHPHQEHNPGHQSYGMQHAPRVPASSYTRPVQPTHNQPPPMYMNRGPPTARNETPLRPIPIAALNPYISRWTIKARVTAKAELRHYHNAKGEGKVFSFDLLDSDGGEIRTTCFNTVADQFYDQIEAGKVYFISKGNIKPAQKAFNHLHNDHEITLDQTSTIQPCLDDDSSILQQKFHFRSIAEIENLHNNTILDIIGIVYSIKPSVSITRKNNTETLKRNLSLRDNSGRSVEVTLWGNFCNKEGQELQNMCDSGTFPVMAMKSARVSEFNGKTIGTIFTSQLFIEPDIVEARELKMWFDNGGKNTASISLSFETARTDVWKTISQIKDEKLGTNEKPDWITVSARVSFIKDDNFFYTACPIMMGDRKCSKKVTNNGDGKWQCDRCEQTVDQCDYRYILQLQLKDHTGLTFATAFQESGEDIMGISAKELHDIRHEEQDEERFTEIMRSVVHNKYNFKLKVKEETYGDEQRVKSTVVKVDKIKHSSDTSFVLDLLKKLDPKIATGSGVSQQTGLPASQMGQYASNAGQHTGLPAGQYGNQYASSVGQRLPASQMGQYGNQYANSVGQQTGLLTSQTGQNGHRYGGSSHGVNCNSCGSTGHSSMNCPSAVNCSVGKFNAVGGNNNSCYKCHQSGHWPNDCPSVNNVSTTNGGGNAGPGRYGSASGQYVGGY